MVAPPTLLLTHKMSQIELELKFVINRPALSAWEESLQVKLNEAGFDVIDQHQHVLENTYFDTQTQLFEQHKIGMRVRGKNGEYEQTLKTQKEVKGGLHERKEYNVDLINSDPDLKRFPFTAWEEAGLKAPDNQELVKQFTTHFTRLTVHLKHELGECELVFDQGEISIENASKPLNEIEIELIDGEPSILIKLAELLKGMDVRLSDASKAAQGYELLQGVQTKIKHLPTHLLLHETISTENVFCLGCETAMAHWQYHEHRFFAAEAPKMLPEIQTSMRLLLQTLSLFLPVLQCQPLLDLQRKVLAFSNRFLWVDELESTRFLLSKKGPLQKTLSRQGAVISYLQGRQAGLLSAHEPEALLCSHQANEIKLAVVHLLLNKPWRTQVKGSEQPVIEHAKGWLSQGRQTLHQSLQSARSLPAANYLAVETVLRQTLFNGFLLSDMFPYSEHVRAPWLDLLIGIDEIRALVLLKQALLEAELEFEEGLIEWVDEKVGHLLQIMERTRQVALDKDIYW